MTKKYIVSALVLVALIVSTFSVASAVQAAPNGKAKGYYSFPGNSLYGRSHNPHFAYKWGGQEFDDIDELIEYIRTYMNQWRLRLQQNVADRNTDADIDIDTLTAEDITDDSALLRGDIEFFNSDYADVWFEYGTSYPGLDERTSKERIDEEDEGIFTEEIDDLNENDRYYYRAVGEDENGDRDYGSLRTFVTDGTGSNDELPDAATLAANEIDTDTVELRGKVDMNDYDNGVVFFVYGLDEDLIDDVDADDSYGDIDEAGDDLQKVRVDTDLDGTETYEHEVENLDENKTYYYRIGVEYEDEDGRETLELGSVRSFVLEDDNTEEPVATTLRPHNVDEDTAELNGSVDMNDYNNGIVFFVYGTDSVQLHAVEDDYDSYGDIDEDGQDLQKVRVDTDLDGTGTYAEDITDLNSNTKYYYTIGVEYEHEEGEPTLLLGGLRSFTTD